MQVQVDHLAESEVDPSARCLSRPRAAVGQGQRLDAGDLAAGKLHVGGILCSQRAQPQRFAAFGFVQVRAAAVPLPALVIGRIPLRRAFGKLPAECVECVAIGGQIPPTHGLACGHGHIIGKIGGAFDVEPMGLRRCGADADVAVAEDGQAFGIRRHKIETAQATIEGKVADGTDACFGEVPLFKIQRDGPALGGAVIVKDQVRIARLPQVQQPARICRADAEGTAVADAQDRLARRVGDSKNGGGLR